MKRITQMAKDENIWALGHPKDIGGGGMPFMDYVYICLLYTSPSPRDS